MHRSIAEAIDRMVIHLAASSMPTDREAAPQREEADQLLRRENFFLPPIQRLENPLGDAGTQFAFTSGISTPWPENNIVHGKLYRCNQEWSGQPAVILLHGWNAEYCYRFHFPVLARRLARAGVSAAMLELPYHAQRRPRRAGATRNFISSNLLRSVEAVQQAVSDTRTLAHGLLAKGVPRVGIWGFSLGAWIAGLVACVEERINLAVLTTPVVEIERAIRELPFCEPIFRGLERQPFALDSLNLASHEPKLPANRILIIESEHDLFVPKETVEELWRRWNEPEIWRLPHGHISILASRAIRRHAIQWIVCRMNE